MGKIKKIIIPENILSFFVIICPILDIASFLYRNKLGTQYSVSTFIRPILPAIVFIYIFIKNKIRDKIKIVEIVFIYLIYMVAHLYIYFNLKTLCSFRNINT